MESMYENLEKLAAEKEDQNWRFRTFLKCYNGLSDKKLDLLVFKTADRVGAAIDCTRCGRCCMKLKPMCSEQDQRQLAAGLSITVEQLRQQYLEYDSSEDEPDWAIKDAPCPFLKDQKCTVYQFRPDNCRQYPYLHEPDFSYRTWGMIERTFTCPIVYHVMEELKKELKFR